LSSTVEAGEKRVAGGGEAAGLNRSLRARQTLAVLRLELGRNFLGRRALLLYVLAGLPLTVLAAVVVFLPSAGGETEEFGELSTAYSIIYGGLILRTLIFFGCAWVFMNLFRGEVVDRSLHYYFLAPVRREVLVVGKYLSGLVATATLFGITTLGSFALLYLGLFPARGAEYVFSGPGFGQALTYAGITALACVGYGAVFLLVGLFFRNPIVPALLIYGWEWLNFLLPPLLKKLSVIHYLQSLAPVPPRLGPFAVLAEPTPAWISVPSLLVFTALTLVLAGLHIRRQEISYAGE
jgi:ABC-type transport system involved in multi-copper enzyme maturation permease subunit